MSNNKPMPWIKQYPTRLNDIRLAKLSDRHQLRYYQLYLLAGLLNAEGAFIQDNKVLTMSDVAYLLHVTDVKQLEKDIATLKQARLIKVNGHGPFIADFKDEQGDYIKKMTDHRERQKRYTERLKADALVTRHEQVSDAQVTPLEEETDQDTRLKDSSLKRALEKFAESKISVSDKDRVALAEIIPNMADDWIPKAIKVALKNKKHSAAYVIGILKNWRTEHANNGHRNSQGTDRSAPRGRQTTNAPSSATLARAKRIVERKRKTGV